MVFRACLWVLLTNWCCISAASVSFSTAADGLHLSDGHKIHLSEQSEKVSVRTSRSSSDLFVVIRACLWLLLRGGLHRSEGPCMPNPRASYLTWGLGVVDGHQVGT